MLHMSVSETGLYQYLSYTDISADDFIFPKRETRRSHFSFKAILGPFCTFVERQRCLSFLLLWNSLSFPGNRGKFCTPLTVKAERAAQGQWDFLCFLPMFAHCHTLLPMREAILHCQAAGRREAAAVLEWGGQFSLGLRFIGWILWQHSG